MLKIGLVGQKGGCGKSTLCRVLVNAILAKSDQSSVLLIDTDAQGSAASYRQAIIERFPELDTRFQYAVCLTEAEVKETLAEAETIGFDYALIDSPGQHAEMAMVVLGVSEKVIIPVRPVIDEYRAQLATISLYEVVKSNLERDGHTPPTMHLMLNDWAANSRMTVEQKDAFRMVMEDRYMANFYVPKRNFFETLGQGYLIHKELEDPEINKSTNNFTKKTRLEDLAIAKQTLENLEAM